THTLAVLDNICAADEDDPDLALRMAALLHDVGKPKTRRYGPEGVSFHHHEVVGAEMADKRLAALHYPSRFREEVRELVYLHLRFHTYRLGWSDKAVRRYVRDAGALLGKLNALVRADCTTRNLNKARELSERMDELELKIAQLAEQENLLRLRPALDGNEIMERLGIRPGPVVGEARDFLMEIRIDEGEISKEEAYSRLDEWWRELRINES
ncbi:MAG: HD domain-containing protein, partial [Acidimicrobiia bacterium]